jgi:hypothetical protein
MKAFLFITVLMALPPAFAEAPVVPKGGPPALPAPQPTIPQAPRAWLGLQVSRPDASITAHLPSLPPGIGFVIRSIDKGGPAEAAGLKEFDVLWKLGDQMLVNEGQLAALLRLSKPGEEIAFSGFRAGKPLEVKLKLGDAPATMTPFPEALVENVILPGECGGPMRVVNVAGKVASYSNEEGQAEVRKEGDVYKVSIQGPKDEPLYEGDLPADGNLDKIPENWRRRVHALRRGLDHALEGRIMPTRQPRPRVVPPASVKP